MALTTIAAAVVIGGAVVNTIGNIVQGQAKAKEDERKAQQLEELSKPGGYYDQLIGNIHQEYANIEAERTAAGKVTAMNALQIQLQEEQRTVQTAHQAATQVAGVSAEAGAGNLGQTGSIEERKAGIQGQANVDIAFTKQAASLDLAKNQLQYEQTIRNENLRQSQLATEETKINFQKTSGISDANALNSESDWLNTWGVGLDVASGALGVAGELVSLGKGPGVAPAPKESTYQTPANIVNPNNVNPPYRGHYDPYNPLG